MLTRHSLSGVGLSIQDFCITGHRCSPLLAIFESGGLFISCLLSSDQLHMGLHHNSADAVRSLTELGLEI